VSYAFNRTAAAAAHKQAGKLFSNPTTWWCGVPADLPKCCSPCLASSSKVPYGLERSRPAQAGLSYGAKIDGKYGAGVPFSPFFRAHINLSRVATYPMFEANISNMTELPVRDFSFACAQVMRCAKASAFVCA
jgi:hypothetical protein